MTRKSLMTMDRPLWLTGGAEALKCEAPQRTPTPAEEHCFNQGHAPF